MVGGRRRLAMGCMLCSIALLALTVLFRAESPDQGEVGSAASPASAPTATPLPVSTPTPNPFAVSDEAESLVITRLWSPAPNTARAEGTIAGSQATVLLTAASQAPREVLLRADTSGAFSVDIAGLDPGPQQVCLADACQRVLVSDPATESRDDIEARIEAAIQLADERVDLATLLPGWTVQIAGPNTSTGGTTNAATRTITINANSGRSLRDYEITVLHEVGHGVDTQWLTDDHRDAFRALRNHDPSLLWAPVDEFSAGDDRWRNSAEDFAEVYVAWVLDNDYAIQTTVVAPQPTDDELVVFCSLLEQAPVSC